MAATVDPTNARIEREFKHPRPLIACRFDPSGRFLFAAAEDSTVQRFDLLTGAVAAFTGHRSWVRALAFLPVAIAAYSPESRTFVSLEGLTIDLSAGGLSLLTTTALPAGTTAHLALTLPGGVLDALALPRRTRSAKRACKPSCPQSPRYRSRSRQRPRRSASSRPLPHRRGVRSSSVTPRRPPCWLRRPPVWRSASSS